MKLSAGRKLCFGVGALGKDLCYAMISTFLMIYLTDTVGLAPLFVGNLFLVARVWDAVNDPMMGFMVDNTRTRWGKFRPWILIGTLLNSAIMIFMFRSPDLEGIALYAYFSVMYILWGMTYTVMDIPYWSMLPSLSSTQQQAFLGAFTVGVPCILLSGAVTPVINMPMFLQHGSQLNPIRHFTTLVQGVFLRDITFEAASVSLIKICAITVVCVCVAVWMFRRV